MNDSDEYLNKIKQLEKEAKELKNFNYELGILNCTISHEIKSPLHAIDAYARIFIEDYGKQVDENDLKLIKNIRNLCSDTLILVNKLMEYIKIQNMEPHNERINLSNIISEIFKKLVSSYKNKNNIQLKFETKLPDIFFDKILITQIISNLISNALKFSQGEKVPIITIGYKYNKGEKIFYVRDNGIGFDMKFSEKLFEMFHRMHSSDEFEGSGLGLFIIKNIIEKYCGRVWIEGKTGIGACTYFTIDNKYILE